MLLQIGRDHSLGDWFTQHPADRPGDGRSRRPCAGALGPGTGRPGAGGPGAGRPCALTGGAGAGGLATGGLGTGGLGTGGLGTGGLVTGRLGTGRLGTGGLGAGGLGAGGLGAGGLGAGTAAVGKIVVIGRWRQVARARSRAAPPVSTRVGRNTSPSPAARTLAPWRRQAPQL